MEVSQSGSRPSYKNNNNDTTNNNLNISQISHTNENTKMTGQSQLLDLNLLNEVFGSPSTSYLVRAVIPRQVHIFIK